MAKRMFFYSIFPSYKINIVFLPQSGEFLFRNAKKQAECMD